MSSDAESRRSLPANSTLEGYQTKRVLGAGGFGITYLACPLGESDGTNSDVVIKEYFPYELAIRMPDGLTIGVASGSEPNDFVYGLEAFEREAGQLAEFRHPNIVKVRRCFRTNGTAYVVMAYEQGLNLSALVPSLDDRLPEDDLRALLAPLLSGVEALHRHGIRHRDIRPANILLRKEGLSPVLLEFGATRTALAFRMRNMSVAEFFACEYTPLELFDRDGNIGPWTDIFALGATFYAMVTGDRPVAALDRREARLAGRPDPQQPAMERARDLFSTDLLGAIDWALEMAGEDRPQDIAAFRQALGLPAFAPTYAGLPQTSADTGPNLPKKIWYDPAARRDDFDYAFAFRSGRAEWVAANDAPDPERTTFEFSSHTYFGLFDRSIVERLGNLPSSIPIMDSDEGILLSNGLMEAGKILRAAAEKEKLAAPLRERHVRDGYRPVHTEYWMMFKAREFATVLLDLAEFVEAASRRGYAVKFCV